MHPLATKPSRRLKSEEEKKRAAIPKKLHNIWAHKNFAGYTSLYALDTRRNFAIFSHIPHVYRFSHNQFAVNTVTATHSYWRVYDRRRRRSHRRPPPPSRRRYAAIPGRKIYSFCRTNHRGNLFSSSSSSSPPPPPPATALHQHHVRSYVNL